MENLGPRAVLSPRVVVSPRKGVIGPKEMLANIQAQAEAPIAPSADFRFNIMPIGNNFAGHLINWPQDPRIIEISGEQRPPIINVESRRILVGGLTQRQIDVILGRPVYDDKGQEIIVPYFSKEGIPAYAIGRPEKIIKEMISASGAQGKKGSGVYTESQMRAFLQAMNVNYTSMRSLGKKAYAEKLLEIYNLYEQYKNSQANF